MRYLFGFLCVCALGMVPLVGCSDAEGGGGSGGSAGSGGTGGSGGSAGSGGTGGSGGADPARCDPALCYDFDCDDADPCTEDRCSVPDGTCSHLAACDDFNDCTTEMCDPADGSCSTPAPVADRTSCEGGTCQSGACVLSGSVLPCTEQGIRNAIAAGDGTYTFACDGTAPVVTQAEIEIDNDVILDGEGKLTVDGNCGHLVFSVRGATAELRRVTVTAGGIFNQGTLTVANSAVIEGGISNMGGGTLTLTNSTVSAGGLSTCSGTTAVANSTLHGGVSREIHKGCDGGTLTIMGSLLAGGCIEGEGQPTSNGYNIESPGNTCGFDQGTDQVNVSSDDLKLGPLQDNGGPTMTHALGAGSVAIDHIPAVDCGVTTDQRGIERPQGDACDVGAFESARAPALASYCAAVLECFPDDETCEGEFSALWTGSGGDLAVCTSAKVDLVECAASLDCDKLGEGPRLEALIEGCLDPWWNVVIGVCKIPVK